LKRKRGKVVIERAIIKVSVDKIFGWMLSTTNDKVDDIVPHIDFGLIKRKQVFKRIFFFFFPFQDLAIFYEE
jgi:hypothetical protein